MNYIQIRSEDETSDRKDFPVIASISDINCLEKNSILTFCVCKMKYNFFSELWLCPF